MKKKFFGICLTVVLCLACVFSFAACNNKGDDDNSGGGGGGGGTNTNAADFSYITADSGVMMSDVKLILLVLE